MIVNKIKRNILLNPGPSTTTDTVKFAQVVLDICPREKEFGVLLESISSDLVKIAGGDDNFTAVLFGGSGTCSMDAVINSVIPKDMAVLIVNNGAYGERMIQIANAYNIKVTEYKCDWHQLPDLNKVENLLLENGNIHAVCCVHHETSSGLLNSINKIGKLAKKYNKIFIVDAISSFAGIPFNVKLSNIDFMISSSNKCIQGMAGISFVICKKNKLIQLEKYPKRSYYLSLIDQYEFFVKYNQMRFTPPVQTIYALRQALDELLDEGIMARYERYSRNWEVLRSGVQELGFRILTNQKDESHLLITLLYPESPHFNFDDLHDALYNKGFTIYPGKISNLNTFRLSIIGDIDEKDIEKFIEALDEVMKYMLKDDYKKFKS